MPEGMIKVLVVIGTRPEAIKLAPVVRELKKHRKRVQCRVCATGQHRAMLDQMLEFFGISVDIDLDLMQADQNLAELAARALAAISSRILDERPDWVVVQGDTTTAMAVSLASFYARIKVAHVEAGLRTNDRWSPFPEEINRRITGLVADLHFTPPSAPRRPYGRKDTIPRRCMSPAIRSSTPCIGPATSLPRAASACPPNWSNSSNPGCRSWSRPIGARISTAACRRSARRCDESSRHSRMLRCSIRFTPTPT